MQIKWILIIALITWFPCSGAAESMSLKDITLNSSKSSFVRKFPAATCRPAVKSSLPTCEAKGENLGGLEIDSLLITLWEDRIVMISALRHHTRKDTVQNYAVTWIDKLRLKYGPPTSNNHATAFGGRSKVERTIWAGRNGDQLMVIQESEADVNPDAAHSITVSLSRADYADLSTKHAVNWAKGLVKDM